MPKTTTDVKPGADSSTAQATEQKTDVAPTFESTAQAIMDDIGTKESSTEQAEAAEGAVLNQNETEEAAKDQQSKDEGQEEETKDEAQEGDVQEGQKKEDDKAHEEAVPYERFKEVNEKVKAYETIAQEHQQLVQYCEQAGISPEQFQRGLELLRLENSDPKAALEHLEARVQELRIASGEGLPSYLQEELNSARAERDEGAISPQRFTLIENRLKETARLRAENKSRQSRSQVEAQQREQQANQQLMSALSSWSQAKQRLDPSFKPKAKPTDPDGKFEDFLSKNTYLWVTQPPKSLQEALALADKAYEQTMGMFKRLTPPQKSHKVMTSTGVSSRINGDDGPKTSDDVMKAIGRKHGYNL